MLRIEDITSFGCNFSLEMTQEPQTEHFTIFRGEIYHNTRKERLVPVVMLLLFVIPQHSLERKRTRNILRATRVVKHPAGLTAYVHVQATLRSMRGVRVMARLLPPSCATEDSRAYRGRPWHVSLDRKMCFLKICVGTPGSSITVDPVLKE